MNNIKTADRSRLCQDNLKNLMLWHCLSRTEDGKPLPNEKVPVVKILEDAQVVTIPGAGFGPGGEGFLRLSAFAPRASCEEACERLKTAMKPN